ncbi:hypothetical protein GUJ93_ZPchr0002g23400 [Zizania palustris]|uniref:Uncharacterized protein n=1 Tax=Zizania palustris TaxID=103762 RepID=A0A8J5VQP7_ZIZPA|nr:hypothetical protein GUJ93_ZPchr0002g23400 [Zizania palustris]
MHSAHLPASPPLSLCPPPVRCLPSACLPFAASPSPRLPVAASAPSAHLPFPFATSPETWARSPFSLRRGRGGDGLVVGCAQGR